MHRFPFLSVLLLFASALSAVASEDFSRDDGKTTIKNSRMEFKFPDLEGNEITHESEVLEGKVILLTLWGSWCPPCIHEIPFLKRLHAEYKDQGLEIVAIAFEQKGTNEEKLANLKKFVEKHGIEYRVLFAGSTLATRTKLPTLKNFEAFPTTMLIGRDGLVRRIEILFDDKIEKSIEHELKKLLAEDPVSEDDKED